MKYYHQTTIALPHNLSHISPIFSICAIPPSTAFTTPSTILQSLLLPSSNIALHLPVPLVATARLVSSIPWQFVLSEYLELSRSLKESLQKHQTFFIKLFQVQRKHLAMITHRC